jgi:hypothetical protein
MSLKVYKGKELIAKMKAVKTSVTNMQNDIASLCISAALHLELHGSDGINVVNDLVKITEKAVHKNSVAVWLREFAPVSWDSKAKAFKFSEAKLAVMLSVCEQDGMTLEGKLLTVPTYHEFTKVDVPFQVVNLLALLKSAVNKAEKADEDEAREHGKEHNLTGLSAVTKLIGLIESGQYTEPKARHNEALPAIN